jgi:poly(hydroxyalkanoate) depolymerase family esterase
MIKALMFQTTSFTTPVVRLVRMLSIVLLAVLPMTSSAASWWCAWFPWLCSAQATGCGTGLTEVSAFGSNPGNLKMCTYVPSGLGASRPLVVALHGCKQQASNYDDETGWIKFADTHRFALLLPQQQQSNNSSQCFNWFELQDSSRDQGEALSIRQMIAKISSDNSIDSQRVFITGLSAGGAMAAVMMATYPELFAGGAIIAGVPYRCAHNAGEALAQCGVSLSSQVSPMKDLTPAAWGDLVRNASSHPGPFPRVSIWQGTSDTIVNPVDQRELIDQWTNVHAIDQVADASGMLSGHEHKQYKDAQGHVWVETVLIQGMGHGTPVSPGNGDDQCGKAIPFVLDVGVCSAFHVVRFWGLDAP